MKHVLPRIIASSSYKLNRFSAGRLVGSELNRRTERNI
jgi:hypothetical protein